jgi:type IV pilus assembly protein PilX
MKNMNPFKHKKQSGAVLIIAMVTLLILTILGVAVMESSVIEERMAGNYMDRNRAFQAAELALRDAEQWVGSQPSAPIAGASAVYVFGGPVPAAPSWWADAAVDDAWWTANGTAADSSAALEGVPAQPRYIIEEYNAVCDTLVDPNSSDCIFVYRVTAMAWSGRNTTVMLQSLFSKRF